MERWFGEVGSFLWKNDLGIGMVATHVRRPDGLIVPICRMKPFGVVMAGAGEFDPFKD